MQVLVFINVMSILWSILWCYVNRNVLVVLQLKVYRGQPRWPDVERQIHRAEQAAECRRLMVSLV